MTDIAVFLYRKRREERLAARGLKPKQYRKSKDLKKININQKKPMYHEDDPDKGRWITTENGHRVHLNEEGGPDKGNEHVIAAMEGKGPSRPAKRSVKDFYPAKSYRDNPEYKTAAKKSREAMKKADGLRAEMERLQSELDKETEYRDFEYDIDKEPDRDLTDGEWDAILHGRSKAKYYTPKGEELKKQHDKLGKERMAYQDEEQEADDQLRLMKQEAAVKQMEAYYTEHEQDFEPKKAESDSYDGFTLETTGTSFGDGYLKSGKGYIAEMSPKEYLERCAFEIFDNGTLESTLNGAIDENVQKYADMMRDGVKFHLPYLNYKEGGQEGRHRAMAAYLNGIDKVPVLIIGNPPSKQDMRSKYRQRERELRSLERERDNKNKPGSDFDIPDDVLLEGFEFDGTDPIRVDFACDKDFERAKQAHKGKRRVSRTDAEEDAQANGNDDGGGHGNTRLPFGLCMRYGIEIGAGWTPKDAWDALAGKGITPSGVYKKLKAGEEVGPEEAPEPPKADPVTTIDKGEKYYVKDLKARRGWGYRGEHVWSLEGTAEWKDEVPEEERRGYKSGWVGRFHTLTDMYHYLKREGVEEFMDPETGELLNPKEMELPRMLYSDGEHGYSALTLGMKKDMYAITGTDFDGKKKTIKEFGTYERAKAWMERNNISEDDVKLSPALKKREAERLSWLTSDKREYVEVHGEKYGDLRIEKGRYGMFTLRGESEYGEFIEKEFPTRTDCLSFLKEQGVEKVKGEDKSTINPQDYNIPKAIATIDGKGYQSLKLEKVGDSIYLEGADLDGRADTVESMRYYETEKSFKKRLKEKYGIDEGAVEIPDDVQQYFKGRAEEDAVRDKRMEEFAEKAIPVGGSKYTDVQMVKDGGYYYLKGYDEHGMEREITHATDLAWMIGSRIERYGLNPDDIIKDKDLRSEYDKIQEIRKDFDSRATRYGGRDYADIELVKEKDDFGDYSYRLVGYDREGSRHKLTYASDLFSIAEEASYSGIGDVGQFAKSAEAKKDWEEHKKRIEEFEEKAVTLSDGGRLVDLQLVRDHDGDYKVVGYDAKGTRESATGYSKSMFDTVKEAERLGIDVGSLKTDSEETKEAYKEYKRAKDKFEAEAQEFGLEKYLDMSIDYEDGWYRIKGTDIKGRRRTITEARTAAEVERILDKTDQYTFETFAKTDAMKEHMKVVQKARDAVATGEYYDMGVDGSAFKSIHADKIGDKWSIKGVDIDGVEKQIIETADWDDAVETLERHKVKDYKLLTRDRTYERPTDGMRHVTLIRGTDGMFRVYADSETKGTHAEMYSCSTEDDARKWLSDNNVDTGGLKTRGMNPNDDKPRNHTQRSLENFDVYRMKSIDGSFIDNMTADEKQETADMLKTVFDQGAYRVARSTSSFGGIIEHGYKSQVETGKAGYGAAKGKDMRKKASKMFFGHDNTLADSEYEKCGYIGLTDEAEDWGDIGHPVYGGDSPMTYTLRKDNLKDRTTYTYGDSLNTRYSMTSAGYAGPDPTIEGISSLGTPSSVRSALKAFKRYKNGEISYQEMFEEIRRRADNRYIELQFHGEVTVKDIEKVSFRSEKDIRKAFEKMSEKRRKNVIRLLRENNIGILYSKTRGSAFEDGWAWVRENYPDAFAD